MDRLTSMAVFIKAAELGSFAATAKALDISPQMVAKHVMYLENRLRTSLLNRTTRRQKLTEIGRNYYERCKIILSEVELADSMAQDMRMQPKGLLRVTAPVIFGSSSLAPLVSRYLKQYPEVEIELILTDRRIDPHEEGFEVLFRNGEVKNSNLIAVPLKPARIIACASPTYLNIHGVPKIPSHLAVHECLIYLYSVASRFNNWQFTLDGKTEKVTVKGRLRSNNWFPLLDAALEGHGIILGPEHLLSDIIKTGNLVQVLSNYQGQTRQMNLLYPSGLTPTSKVQSFVKFVSMELGY
ncbi:LysR family transcriptional regulator [Providencia burhodogranariea]|uniref:LysR family transcriptional regulator n=1 Tax=Providencia burhodogranariea DSM 19968 TaxID=1141662 RepID=K8WN67_9GAMM|nr:LysR family transcriptional regulator [Providencia burhodogranariea DSM 19968]